MRGKMRTDVSISGTPMIGWWEFYQHTTRAKKWVKAHVDAAIPDYFPTDRTDFAMDIAKGMFDAGLVIEINGRELVAMEEAD
jgi:hypothetical protein